MAVTYNPGSFQWQAVAEPEWSVDSWEICEATLLFRGPRPFKKSFEDGIKRFQPMPNFNYMRLMDWKAENATASFPSIVAKYVGFRYGIPPVKGVPSTSAQVLTASGKDSVSGLTVSGTVTYRASRTEWEWYEITVPADNPRYNTVIIETNPLDEIELIQVTPNSDGTISTDSFVAVINSLFPELVVSDYTYEPIVPNAIWKCKATIDYKLLSAQ